MNPWLNILPKESAPTLRRVKGVPRGIPEIKPYLCKDCGETNPENFYAYYGNTSKSRCKLCKNKRDSLRRFQREGRPIPEGYVYREREDRGLYKMPHKCKVCGITGESNFYPPMKSFCKKCRNKRIVARRREAKT